MEQAPTQPTIVYSPHSNPILGEAKINQQIARASLLLRLGIVFVFLYAAVTMSLDPQSYGHYFPSWMRAVVPTETLLHLFSVYEVILSVWLLTGKKVLYPALLSAATFAGITLFNLDSFNILFRNVAIFFASLALVALSFSAKNTSQLLVVPGSTPIDTSTTSQSRQIVQ